MFRSVIQLIRVKDWIKNIVIFFPIIFSNNIFLLENITNVLVSFFIFSLTTSSVYILNDILDYKDDKLHKLKRHIKPLASDSLSLNFSLILFFLFIIAITILLILFPELIYFILIYLVINVSYSFFLKRVKYLEMLLISIGYLIRLFLGSHTIKVETSFSLAISVFCLAMFVISIKRSLEVLNQETLRIKKLNYSILILKLVSKINGAIFILCVFIFILFSNNTLIIILPFLIFVVYEYYQVSFSKNIGEFPIDLIFNEKKILFSSLIIICVTIFIYI
tara:strand:- start:1166 stop:1999 length:834 start_codon:yes stop_codon:yes gene_type:complete